MIDVMLNDYDNRLVDMYLFLFNTCTMSCYGEKWIINTTEDTIEFKTYKSFINFVESEIKEALLSYAFNKELDELVGKL